MPFSCPPGQLLPNFRSLHIAYNPLKSDYVEKLDSNQDIRSPSEFPYDFKKEDTEKEVTKNVMVSHEKSELNIKETGPMSRIEELDISGVDTKSVNVCYLLSQLPRLKVYQTTVNLSSNQFKPSKMFLKLSYQPETMIIFRT